MSDDPVDNFLTKVNTSFPPFKEPAAMQNTQDEEWGSDHYCGPIRRTPKAEEPEPDRTLGAILAAHQPSPPGGWNPAAPVVAMTPAPEPEPDKTNPKDVAGSKKAPLRFVPPALLLHVGKVMETGAAKYGSHNWRAQPIRMSIYIEAAMRHLLALQDGQDIDPESGHSHVAHAAAGMGILLDALETGNLIDDRPSAGPAAKIIERFTVRS